MDNLTHSLTGAIAKKVLPQTEGERITGDPRRMSYDHKVLFWLLVGCANLPDIDVFLGLVLDPIAANQQHRGLSHSIFFAPVFAIFPAYLFRSITRFKDFKSLWITAVIGIYLHIFFDLVTSYGTQIFQPFTSERYSLDWMFIIDPFFTIPLLLLLIAGRYWKDRKYEIHRVTGVFVVAYVIAIAINHHVAVSKLEADTTADVYALPQPLSMFRWMGLTQSNGVTTRSFISNLDDTRRTNTYVDSNDHLTQKALATYEGSWHHDFSRFPHTISYKQGDTNIVELLDLQFAFDEVMAKELGFENRQAPFGMKFYYLDTVLHQITFNGKKLRQ